MRMKLVVAKTLVHAIMTLLLLTTTVLVST